MWSLCGIYVERKKNLPNLLPVEQVQYDLVLIFVHKKFVLK